MVSFSQRLQKPVGLMSLATRVGLAAEDRLASGALPSPTHPGSLSPSSQAEPCTGRASTAMGAAVVRVEHAAEAAGCPSP